MLKKLRSIFIAFIITLFFLIPYLALRQVETEREIQRNKYIASQEINDISSKLIEEINKSIEYVEVLDIIIKNNPNSPEIINTYSEMILKEHNIISNIAIAPDAIIKWIYPTEPNKKAIGHDLMKDPLRYPFIKKAIDERTAIMQGPVEAVQGGVLIFNRKPIFIKENNEDIFWGICAVSIDFERLVTYCGINENNQEYYLALKVPKTDGFNDFIWGNTECFEKESIINTISFGDQKWEFLIYPKRGWENSNNNCFGLESSDFLYIFLSVVLFVFLLWHLNLYYKNAVQSRIDSLTGTLNKNTFTKQVIKNLRHKREIQAIIVIDINNFKIINDRYGHLTGDIVIAEVANRLIKVLRNHDLLSRWGGDEFVIYISELRANTDIYNIINRIYQEINTPFDAKGVLIDVGIALGYSIYPDNGKTYEELYEKADRMMYANKETNKLNGNI